MSRPATRTRPEVAAVYPAIIRMVVVLPAPFGPRKPTISPFATSKERSWMMVRVPYRLETDSREITADALMMGHEGPPEGRGAFAPAAAGAATYTTGCPSP